MNKLNEVLKKLEALPFTSVDRRQRISTGTVVLQFDDEDPGLVLKLIPSERPIWTFTPDDENQGELERWFVTLRSKVMDEWNKREEAEADSLLVALQLQ